MSKMSDSNPDPPTTRRRVARATVAALAALALVAAGCGDDDESTATEGGSGGGSGDDMTIDLVAPEDGAAVGDTFDVEVDPSVDIGEPDTGLHHVHLYYDGNEAEGEYDLVYDPTFTVERDLAPGEHTLEAVIANADHSLTDARDEITFTVGEDGAGTGGGTGSGQDDGTDDTDATDTTTSDDGGYDY